MKPSRIARILSIAIPPLLASNAIANDYSWRGPSPGTYTSPTSGSWNTGSNWTNNSMPPNDNLYFGGSGSGTFTSTNNTNAPNVLQISLNSTSSGQSLINGNALDDNDSGKNLVILQNQSGRFEIANNISLNAASLSLQGNGTGIVTLSGNLSALAGTMHLAKPSGTSTFYLTGTNTYNGNSTISTGTLRVMKAASLPGYNVSNRVTIGASGTVEVMAGGTGQWSSSEIDSLRTNSSRSAGAKIGFFVEDGNSFSYGSNINNSNLGITKSGPGLLIFSGNNTYTGGTTVAAGSLRATTAASLPTSSVSVGAAGTLQILTPGWTSAQINTIHDGATWTSGSKLELIVESGSFVHSNNLPNKTFNLVKSGDGTLTLTTNNNDHSGGVTVAGGLLLANNASGNHGTGHGTTNVLSGGALGGDGVIDPAGVNVLSGGTLTGGALAGSGLTSIGQLEIKDDVTLNSGATLHVDIGGNAGTIGTAGTHFDQILLTGNGNTFTPGGANLVVKIRDGAVASTYRIVDTDDNDVDSSIFAGLTHNVEYSVPNSQLKYKVLYNHSYIDLQITFVPEPTSGLALLCGTMGLIRRRRTAISA